MRTLALAALAAALVACSPSEKAQTRSDLDKAGHAVKKELKNDAAFVKDEALKAREETQKGVAKLKKDVNSRDANPPRDDNPPPRRDAQ